MRFAMTFVLVATITSTSVEAADRVTPVTPITPEVFEKRWEVAFGAYGWAASVDGQVGVRSR